MKLGIEVASIYDNKTGYASFLYDLNVVENGKILRQKRLKSRSGVFSANDREYASDLLSEELKGFIEEVQEEYGNNIINIYHSQRFLEKKIKQKDIENAIFIDIYQKPNTVKSKILYNNIFKEMRIKKIVNENRKQNEHKAPKKKKMIGIHSINRRNNLTHNIGIDEFLKNKMDKESLNKQLLSSKLSTYEEDNIYVDFALALDAERKRVGIKFEFYDSHRKLTSSKNPLHTIELIQHGHFKQGALEIKEMIDEFNTALKKKRIKLNLNITPRQKKLSEIIIDEYKNPDFKVLKHPTTLSDRTNQGLRSKINRDIDIHLQELKKPETVAIFTDGSVNRMERIGGSGVLIRHMGRNKLLASKNETADTTHAEFKAIFLACQEIDKNPYYQGKKIMIVSDNDLMSYSIRKKLKDPFSDINRPYLDEICYLIKKNNMDLNFHNVKSHVYDNIKPEDEDLLYDFKYNNVVDLVAKTGAGFNLSKEEMKIVVQDTAHDPKYKGQEVNLESNNKSTIENREKRFKEAKERKSNRDNKREEERYKRRRNNFRNKYKN